MIFVDEENQPLKIGANDSRQENNPYATLLRDFLDKLKNDTINN